MGLSRNAPYRNSLTMDELMIGDRPLPYPRNSYANCPNLLATLVVRYGGTAMSTQNMGKVLTTLTITNRSDRIGSQVRVYP
jgi:hypothetical protein